MEFTYQPKNTNQLERYEWDNLWFDNAPDMTTDRVVVIGDSISCGYRNKINEIANGRYFVDGIGTSKGVDNPSFPALIDYFMAQTKNVKVISINNGLHGWHLNEDEYEVHFTKLVDYISNKFEGVKLIMVTTTPTFHYEYAEDYPDNLDRITERNKRALKIAEKYNMTVCDLFAVVIDKPEAYLPGGVHFTPDGYKILAEECHKVISDLI